MQDEDLKLIRQIVASGGRKCTAGNVDRTRYDRLVDLGWLTPFKTNIKRCRISGDGQGPSCSRCSEKRMIKAQPSGAYRSSG